MGSTLGGGVDTGVAVGLDTVGVNMCTRDWRAQSFLLYVVEKGVSGNGLCNTWMKSFAGLDAASSEDTYVMLESLVKHLTVQVMRSLQVLGT